MERLGGLMPYSFIELEGQYRDQNNMCVVIQAGTKGWTILYENGDTYYNDFESTAEDNLKRAYSVACMKYGLLNKISVEKFYKEQ